jgi:hypothetical protein
MHGVERDELVCHVKLFQQFLYCRYFVDLDMRRHQKLEGYGIVIDGREPRGSMRDWPRSSAYRAGEVARAYGP